MALNRTRPIRPIGASHTPVPNSTFRPTGKAAAQDQALALEPFQVALRAMQEALETKMAAQTQAAIEKAVAGALREAAGPSTPAHVKVVQEDPEVKVFRARVMSKFQEATLTDQEIRIGFMVLRGLSNEEICQIAEISLKTVKHHIGAIFRKFRVDSRAQLSARIFPVGE